MTETCSGCKYWGDEESFGVLIPVKIGSNHYNNTIEVFECKWRPHPVYSGKGVCRTMFTPNDFTCEEFKPKKE